MSSDVEMEEGPKKALAYDPDQDPEEKRAVRRNYRTLQKDAEGVFNSFALIKNM